MNIMFKEYPCTKINLLYCISIVWIDYECSVQSAYTRVAAGVVKRKKPHPRSTPNASITIPKLAVGTSLVYS